MTISRVLASIFIVLVMASHARAQNLEDAPIGTSFQSVAKFGPRQLPLPPGEWTLLSREMARSTGNTAAPIPILRVYLVQMVGGRLERWIHANTNTQVSATGWTRNRNVCDRGDVHVGVSDSNYNERDTECWIVNHYGLTPGATAAAYIRAFYDQTADKRRPVTALGEQYFLVKDGSFLDVTYYSNPESAGFEKTPTADWRGNPWHRERAAQDPKKLAYIAKLKAEGESLLPLVKRGMNGRL